jgi:antirestriction protein
MPSIYVGTYAKYNSGSIAGKWLDLEDYSSSEEFFKACAEIHQDEEDPEYMFQDWEDIPDGMVSESHISSELWDYLELDEDDRELLTLYRENMNQDGDLSEAQDAFQGKYRDAEDFAYEIVHELYNMKDIPDFITCHIDWEGVARDLGYDYNYVTHDGECWVFRTH